MEGLLALSRRGFAATRVEYIEAKKAGETGVDGYEVEDENGENTKYEVDGRENVTTSICFPC